MEYKTLVPNVALAIVAAQPATATAEISANIGWVSEYIFRGVFQEDSSAFAGVDYAGDEGFYAGTWAADVGDGLETDLYFGYSGGDDLKYKLGYTGYFYTDDFDDTYNEINLGIGYGTLALDVAVGEWEGFGTAQNYTFTTLTLTPEAGPYFKVGSFSQDFDGEYFESGYVWSMAEHGIDLSVAVTASEDLNLSDGDDGESGDYAIVFGVKKTIGIRE